MQRKAKIYYKGGIKHVDVSRRPQQKQQKCDQSILCKRCLYDDVADDNWDSYHDGDDTNNNINDDER
eukprot:scaffold127024_cov15-Prasinocladus_malaysianus.AAC.1